MLITNAENLSISRAFRLYMDHGNSSGTDLWSSFQDFGVVHPPHTRSRGWLDTDFNLMQADVLEKGSSDPEHEILSKLTEDTDLVVFSHVIRDHGRILDVPALCREIRRRSSARILVDGAQALGTVPSVRVAELGCDFYVAAPHKTLGCYPLGLLWVNDEMKGRLETTSFSFPDRSAMAIVLAGMFSPDLAVAPTVDGWLSLPEVAGFTEAISQLSQQGRVRGSDASKLTADLNSCRMAFLSELSEAPRSVVEVVQAPPGRQCASIASFRLPGEDNRAIVDHLWRDHCVFASYIARTDLIRFSFGLNNSPSDARTAARLVGEVSDALRVSVTMSSSQIDKAKPVMFSIVD